MEIVGRGDDDTDEVLGAQVVALEERGEQFEHGLVDRFRRVNVYCGRPSEGADGCGHGESLPGALFLAGLGGGHGSFERTQLLGAEGTPLPRGESRVAQGPDSRAHQTRDIAAHCGDHAANLAVASFVNDDPQEMLGRERRLCRRSQPVFERDAFARARAARPV